MVELAGVTDAFLASYSADGGLRFVVRLGGSLADEGLNVAVAPDGASRVTGAFRGSMDLDPGPDELIVTSNGQRDIFLAALTAAGDFAHGLACGGSGDDVGRGVAVDASGRSYLTGSFKGEVDFDPGPDMLTLTATGSLDDAFLAAYSATGGVRFAFALGNDNADSGQAVAVDADGRPTITGGFIDVVDFDPGPGEFSLEGTNDTFVAGYDADGAFRHAYQFEGLGTSQANTGLGLAIAAGGQVTVVGEFSDDIDVAPGDDVIVLETNGAADAFVVQTTPTPVAAPLPGLASGLILTRLSANPAAGQLGLRLAARRAGTVQVALYDLAGRRVVGPVDVVLAAEQSRELTFGLRGLASGLYLARASDGREVATARVVVVR
jgi:hypothetical protein